MKKLTLSIALILICTLSYCQAKKLKTDTTKAKADTLAIVFNVKDLNQFLAWIDQTSNAPHQEVKQVIQGIYQRLKILK